MCYSEGKWQAILFIQTKKNTHTCSLHLTWSPFPIFTDFLEYFGCLLTLTGAHAHFFPISETLHCTSVFPSSAEVIVPSLWLCPIFYFPSPNTPTLYSHISAKTRQCHYMLTDSSFWYSRYILFTGSKCDLCCFPLLLIKPKTKFYPVKLGEYALFLCDL